MTRKKAGRARAPSVEIHERIRGLVADGGIPHAVIRKKTGWNEQKLWRLLYGHTKLRTDHVITFAKVLGKSVAELYGEVS